MLLVYNLECEFSKLTFSRNTEAHNTKSISYRLGHATNRGGGSEIELRVHKSCSAWSPINQSADQLIASAVQVLMFALLEVRGG